jgi:hypothetical protein
MNFQGLLTCCRYALPPNSLSYCGPEKTQELINYQIEKFADKGLAEIIQEFQTLYPYLAFIAHENNIKDPFDPRIVEAYWVGNTLLDTANPSHFYRYLNDILGLKKKLTKKQLSLLFGTLDHNAIPHHTFHVLNVFVRTGHHSEPHTLETMDACRIGWGKVIRIRHTDPTKAGEGSLTFFVQTKPLIIQNDKLSLGNEIVKKISFPFRFPITDYRFPITDHFISFHWNMFCDILTDSQVKNLELYTNHAIRLANNHTQF